MLDEEIWARERIMFEDDDGDYDYVDYIYFYENDECFWEDDPKEKKRRKEGGGPRKQRMPGDFNKAAVESRLIATFHQGMHMLVKRNIRKINPDDVVKPAIPRHPIPV